jgi:TolB-like protein/DNA-binding winged helix-turn-helix (wHTH) protein/cytochrome c-type biogenesis protein CcmH/NrfG
MNPSPSQVYEFGDFRMDVGKRLLWRREGTVVPLRPRVFETLVYLVEHNGVVLDKERLMEAVWPDSIVEENNLSQNISTLRRVFGEEPGSHRFIVTVPGRGYRFVADVTTRDNADGEANKLELASEAASPEPRVASEPTAPDLEMPHGKRKARPVLLAVIAITLIGAAAFAVFSGRTHNESPAHASPSATAPEKSIAVLPFENLSDEKENAYFAAGVQDEILSNLARIADLKVISRTSANLYKSGNPRSSREIGRQLGVAYLLEGSVQRVGHRLRVNTQLVDARTDAHLWAQTYDRDVTDVLAIQSEIARTIADQLRAKMSPAERAAITQPPTADLIANDLYVRALELEFTANEQANQLEAVRLLEQAVARDPQFVRAYCKLGEMHLALYFAGHDHTPARREWANAAIERAAQIQPDAGEVHLARARYFYHGFLDYDRARAELNIARRTLPNEPAVYFLTANIDRRQGRFEEAMSNFERAVGLDPRNIYYLMTAGNTYNGLHRYSEASRLHERALSISPHDDYWVRIERTFPTLYGRADIRPLRRELNAIRAEAPEAAPEISSALFQCAIFERDSAAANRALAVLPPEGGRMAAGTNFSFPREWFAGLAARIFNDPEAARTAFTAARGIAEKIVRDQPDDAPAWSLLGRIDAALGRKEDAIKEGRRACELLPISKDAWAGPYYVKALASIYAWTGESDLALEQLALLAQKGLHYGELKLDPEWDALRADPRFEKLIASYARKDISD